MQDQNKGIIPRGAIGGMGKNNNPPWCVAIDPDAGILKMGQKVFIENYGYGICNDVGGAIKGWHIDLCFDSHQEALNWGVKLVRVYVIEGKENYK